MNKENIFDGKPSIDLNHRPFFSIIIPCYNSRKTIGNLLNSILDQNMSDDIEVILSDDNSTESYQDIVDEYREKLCIRQIKTDYNFAPGNTREKGVSIATGEWLSFADHDDVYINDSLKLIKDAIVENEEEYYAIANFYEADPESLQILREHKQTMNWNHAKFYNFDNLWKAFDIHFQKDLLTHEDICISSQINCAMESLGKSHLAIDEYCYIWLSRPTSVSRTIYGENHGFLEIFFSDYIKSTAEVYFDAFLKENVSQAYAIDSVIEVICYCYFYMQGFVFHQPDTYIKANEEYCRRLLVKAKNIFGLTNKAIWDYLAWNDAVRYTSIKASASMGSGPFIETETLMQWLDKLHEDIKPRITMSDAMHK